MIQSLILRAKLGRSNNLSGSSLLENWLISRKCSPASLCIFSCNSGDQLVGRQLKHGRVRNGTMQIDRLASTSAPRFYSASKNTVNSGNSSQFVSEPDHTSVQRFIEKNINCLRIYDEIDLLPGSLDWTYLLDEKNLLAIDQNNKARKGSGNIHTVVNFS